MFPENVLRNQDFFTKSLRSCTGNRTKMLLKCHLGIKCHSNYNLIIRLLQYSSAWTRQDPVHDRSLLGRCFRVLSCPFWSTVLQCGAQLPIHTLNYWILSQWCPVFNWGVFEFVIAHRPSVAILCKIRGNPVHPLNGAPPGPYVAIHLCASSLLNLVATQDQHCTPVQESSSIMTLMTDQETMEQNLL